MKKTVIIALGGNALSPKEEAGTINQQFRHTRDTLKSVMHFVNLDYNICITHGNGPQVGAELSKNEIWIPETLKALISKTNDELGIKGKDLFFPMRLAIYGECRGPDIPSIYNILGRDEIIVRFNSVIKG